MKNIKKKLANIFKFFSYKTFALLHGKIKGKINFKDDSRIKVEIVKRSNDIKYKVFRINNGRLYTDRIHDTAIILDNFIVDGPSYQLRPLNNDTIDKNIVFEKGTPRIKKKLKGKVLSLLTGGAGNDNYWHWLFDVLPRLALCEKILDLNDIDFFLLPNKDRKFQKETLSLLNIPIEKCLSSKFFRHIESSELLITDHPYVVTNDATHDIQNIPVWIAEWLKKKYLINKLDNNLKLPKKIYIDRRDSLSNVKNLRTIINEEKVKNFLIKKGFESITLGNLHFSKQVQIFNNADIIVGLHGAAFANLCFCKPSTKIIELKSNTAGKMIENMAAINNLTYKSISCEVIDFDIQNQFGHIKVSVNLLEKLIESLD